MATLRHCLEILITYDYSPFHTQSATFQPLILPTGLVGHIYGKLPLGAESHYEFCCSFPQNARTLHALESSIFIGILCRHLRLSDLVEYMS